MDSILAIEARVLTRRPVFTRSGVGLVFDSCLIGKKKQSNAGRGLMISSLSYSRNLDDSRVVDAGAVGFFIPFNLGALSTPWPTGLFPFLKVKSSRTTVAPSKVTIASQTLPLVAPVDACHVSRRSSAASRYRCTLEFLDLEFNLCSPPNMCNQPCGSHGRCRWPF